MVAPVHVIVFDEEAADHVAVRLRAELRGEIPELEVFVMPAMNAVRSVVFSERNLP